MSDYIELKKLAEAAPEGPWFGPEYAPGTSYVFDVDLGTLLAYESIDSEKDACLRYVAAANPAAVLALIAENERLRIGMKGDYDLDAWLEWRADRDQLRHDHDKWESLYRSEHATGTRLLDTLTGFRTERDQLRAEVAGLKTGYEAYEAQNAALKEGIEALLEAFAKELYERWAGQSGYVPWVERGNSLKQDEARRLARAAMGKGERS
ncbi:hypothetical protein [Pseudomonas sp. NPDC096950]|uniref:hypothetical protein n=1 Tax=Pseudomonas sp. NPDC096950 TaxID=3364485 RepID=UPI00383A87AF